MSVFMTVGLVTAVLVGQRTPAHATTVADALELDGNPQDIAFALPLDDWQTLAASQSFTPAAGVELLAKTAVPVADPDTGADASYFTGGGSKDVRPIEQWLHQTGDVAPDKDEITNAFAAAYRVPDSTAAGGDSDALPDLLVGFGADRFSNDGDAVIGFWFFKNRIGRNANGTFSGTHAVGDVLIVSDFSGGGDIATIRIFTWNGTGLSEVTNIAGSPDVFDCAPDAGGAHNPFACAIENANDGVPAVWAYTPKPNTGAPGFYPHNTFYEGAINLSAVLPGSDQCFASFLAETRSSTSPTAQLKDFALGSFPICEPSTVLTATPSVAAPEIVVAGDSVSFTFFENNNGNVPLSAVHVDTNNDLCVPGSAVQIPPVLDGGFNLGDLNDDNRLDPGETWQFSCTVTNLTSLLQFDAIGHGTDPVGRDVTACTTSSATQVCMATEQTTAMAVPIRPSTLLSMSANPPIAKENDTITFTIVEINDGVAPAGFESFLDLTGVAISTGNAACDEDLGSFTGDDGDGVLERTEAWTYTCTVPAPADDFTLTATATGTVLAGTPRARQVTAFDNCANVAGSIGVVGVLCDGDERTSASVIVIRPSTSLTVTASAVITYLFSETNDSVDAPLVPPVATVRESVISLETASVCNVAAVSFTGGDSDSDKILDPLETWTFTCKGSLAGPLTDTGTASTTATGLGHGIDGTEDDVTFCAAHTATQFCDPHERDGVTVSIQNHAQG